MAGITYVDCVEEIGERLAFEVVQYMLGEDHLLRQDKLSQCLRSCVVEMLDKHAILFTSFAKRLAIEPNNIGQAFLVISDELFQDGITWSRIIALYALAGRLALFYKERKMNSNAEEVPYHLKSCIRRISPFVRKHGGWEQICVEYPLKDDISGIIRTCLMLTGASLGVVAGLLAVFSYFPNKYR